VIDTMNKPKKRWLDAQIVIASLAMTFTLALWNLFASGGPKGSATQSTVQDPQVPEPTSTQVPAATGTAVVLPSGQLAPMKVLLGGKAPVAPVVVSSSGRGSSGSRSASAPVTTTRSSHP
jgi:hypothetical protein